MRPEQGLFCSVSQMPFHNLRKFSVIAALIVVVCSNTFGQHALWGSNLLLEGRVNYGFMINHHLEMKIFNAHFPSYEINLGKETYGNERWQYMYGYPYIGISFWYSQLGNSKFLGQANAVFPYVNYPIIRNQKHELNFRVGVGLAYLTKCFDRIDNYKYIAIGSHVNAAINLMTEYRVRFSPRMNAAVGASIMHFSNGSTKTPNYGINTPSINVALAYRLSKENAYLAKKVLPTLRLFEFPEVKSIDFSGGFTAAYKDMGNEFGQKFMIYNFFGNVTKQFSFKSSGGIGFDVTHDGSDYYLAQQNNLPLTGNQLLRIGVGPVYQLSMSKLSYNFCVGYYLRARMQSAKVYFKLGLQYMITPWMFANITLRTHFGQADFVGFGLGFKIPWVYFGPK